ncbi:DJ-1/PfpI family protein [Kitasatospora sp. NPDC091207]|uniref:DJ-1/PfpI family protein n=1 Tax=Kitasatospora sp. NPDC091207 TaxID=3364083 RepID=UPI00381F8C65
MPQSPHRVVVAAFAGVELLDVTGPAEVFSVATRVAGPDRPGYVVQIATADGAPVATSSGVRLMADLTLDAVDGRMDTLLVAGAIDLAHVGHGAALDLERVRRWAEREHERLSRLESAGRLTSREEEASR